MSIKFNSFKIKINFIKSFCAAVSDEVQKMHEQLTRSLNIDAILLAAMKERGLLTQADFEKLQSMLVSSRCDIAAYFISNILLRWSPGVFVAQLELFSDALANHDDCSNKRFAEDFNKLLEIPKSRSLTSSSATYHDCQSVSCDYF